MSKEQKKPRIRYSYHRWQLARRFVREHVLAIARRSDAENQVTFGWSLCIPSRWETTMGKEFQESYFDTHEKRIVSTQEYNNLLDAAVTTVTNTDDDAKENDGLLVVDEKKDKIRADAEERLSHIIYNKSNNRKVVMTLVKGDMFCKKTGREQAINRLNDSPITINLEPGQYAIEGIMDYLRSSADFPRQVADIAELEYQKIRAENYESIHSEYTSSEEDSQLETETPMEMLRQLWNSDLGRATIVTGAICVGWLLGVFLCSLV